MIILDAVDLHGLMNESKKPAADRTHIRPPTKRARVGDPQPPLVVPQINGKYFQVSNKLFGKLGKSSLDTRPSLVFFSTTLTLTENRLRITKADFEKSLS